MQRRLIFALVGIALTSVVLVGAGVLFLAQIGARDTAEAEIEAQLDALAQLLPGEISPEQLGWAREALGLDELELVVVDGRGTAEARLVPIESAPSTEPDPSVVPPPPTVDDDGLAGDEPETPATGATGSSVAGVTGSSIAAATGAGAGSDEAPSGAGPQDGADQRPKLEGSSLERFLAGETIILRPAGTGVTEVQGVRRIDLDRGIGDGGGDVAVGLLATRAVAAIGPQARVWFGVSAASVLAASGIAAWFLARQLSKPIRQIQRATTSIAAGDFKVRVDDEGNDEFAELGRGVNRMARELERSKKLDQQFLMSVSHDLRTPLTAITGYAEALSDRAVYDTVHTGDVIRNHAHRLERLVGDLLDLARLDANRFQLHWQTLDIGVVVGRTVAGLAQKAGRHHVHVKFDNAGTLLVRADADRLAQVVGNVVDNAIRFATSEIVASVRSNGTHALIEICDDGPGIAPQDLPYIFERLYVSKYQPLRAENPSGMGLAIVRELTLAMGGTVAAGYRPGGGARMTLRLPLLR